MGAILASGRDCVYFVGKRVYLTRPEAITAAAETWLRLGEKILPYRCKDISHWHIGHPIHEVMREPVSW